MEKRESVFMQMHNGTRTGEGSFNHGLKDLFYLADMDNRRKLVKAFPEFFGDEVPEFGIKKVFSTVSKETEEEYYRNYIRFLLDDSQLPSKQYINACKKIN